MFGERRRRIKTLRQMSYTKCSWPQKYLWATFTDPWCSGGLCFPWQKQQTSRRQAETGVASCSCILMVLGYYWRMLHASPWRRAMGFRWSLANTAAQWETEAGEPGLALLALEHLWQISQLIKWQWQLHCECLLVLVGIYEELWCLQLQNKTSML